LYSNKSFTFYFSRYFLKNKFSYKLCEDFTLFENYSSIDSIVRHCKTYCIVNRSAILSILTLISKSLKMFLIKLFWKWYKKKSRIAYIETFKTDFDRMIYNFGGILGLWFGISPVKAADLLQHIPVRQIFGILMKECTRFYQYLIAICIRTKQNIES